MLLWDKPLPLMTRMKLIFTDQKCFGKKQQGIFRASN
jgi:hypothetical protein